MSSIVADYGRPLDPMFGTIGFLAHIESLKVILKMNQQTRQIPIPPDVAYQYAGNVPGLLLSLGLLRRYHLIVMRVNGIDSAAHIPTQLIQLYIPPVEAMDNVINLYSQHINTLGKLK